MASTDTEHAKTVVDALSIATVIGSLAQVLPAIAATFSIIWSIIRISETKTVQSWLKRSVNNE